ncbi:hypothetical protein HPP92_018328 [Vanilla planifolia]|uniref:Uncharacterized protein n=1 Tax=Vanilla planifolia TaxID=51239 RepID=A0A835UMB2_VANPL|nr:hypothetical protein HPP92_018328 [Vanilla planifolia]
MERTERAGRLLLREVDSREILVLLDLVSGRSDVDCPIEPQCSRWRSIWEGDAVASFYGTALCRGDDEDDE